MESIGKCSGAESRERRDEHGDLYVREEMRRPGPDLRTQ